MAESKEKPVPENLRRAVLENLPKIKRGPLVSVLTDEDAQRTLYTMLGYSQPREDLTACLLGDVTFAQELVSNLSHESGFRYGSESREDLGNRVTGSCLLPFFITPSQAKTLLAAYRQDLEDGFKPYGLMGDAVPTERVGEFIDKVLDLGDTYFVCFGGTWGDEKLIPSYSERFFDRLPALYHLMVEYLVSTEVWIEDLTDEGGLGPYVPEFSREGKKNLTRLINDTLDVPEGIAAHLLYELSKGLASAKKRFDYIHAPRVSHWAGKQKDNALRLLAINSIAHSLAGVHSSEAVGMARYVLNDNWYESQLKLRTESPIAKSA